MSEHNLPPLQNLSYFLENSTYDMQRDAIRAYAKAYARKAIEADRAQRVPTEPTLPENSQEWAGIDASTAFLLINRHADGWPDIELMMNEWRLANPSAPQPVAQPSERTHATAPPHVYVQEVPSHCDRIVWRGSYYHLPLPVTQPKPEQAAQTERKPIMEAGLTFQQADAAAKELADRMDYPWSHMTQKGRDNMREIAQAVIEAAHGITAERVVEHRS